MQQILDAILSGTATRLFDDVLGHVSAYYVDSIGETDLYDRATRGMLEQLKDPYSVLLTGDDYKALTEQTSGNYAGPRDPDRRARRLDHRRGAAAGDAGRAGRRGHRRPDHRSGRQVHRGWKNDEAVKALRGEAGSK